MEEKWSDYFVYDETSPSRLRWKISRGRNRVRAGDVVGSLDSRGRWCTRASLNGKYQNYFCHRIVWELHNEKIPGGLVIDHIDGNVKNNCICNLRLVTPCINSRNQKKPSNNTSGVTGVSFECKASGLQYWLAQYCDNNKVLRRRRFSVAKLGYLEAKQQAIQYREEMLKIIGGYSVRHGT